MAIIPGPAKEGTPRGASFLASTLFAIWRHLCCEMEGRKWKYAKCFVQAH